MKHIEEVDVILGIRIKHENEGLTITQSHYIKKILKKFSCEGFGPVSTPMETGYSDASWTTNSKDHTSATALATVGKEAKWLRNFIYEIPWWPKPISLISMHCDSAANLAKAYSQIYNGKSRHLGVRNSMVRELITNGVISVDFVRSQQNLADHLTKGLARDLVHKSAIGMGLKSEITSFTCSSTRSNPSTAYRPDPVSVPDPSHPPPNMLGIKCSKAFPLLVMMIPLLLHLATKFRIQQYLQNKHYALWEVIEFGDSYKAPPEETGKGPASESSAKKKGRTIVITTEDMLKRKNDVKARTTLLLALPDEHQLRLSKNETAKELWEAIQKTFETLEQTFNRLHAILSHLEFMDVEIEQDDLNHKFLTSLAPEWLISGKGEVYTASVPTASIHVSTASTDVAAASLSNDTVCAYIATQSNGSQIKYKDITQIDEDDIKEMDIKWNMDLLSMRADRFWKKTDKKITIQGSDVSGFDKSKVECFSCHKMGRFAREWRAPRSQDRADNEVLTEFTLMDKSSSSLENEVEARLVEFKEHEIKFCEKIRGLERDVEIRDNKIEHLKNELEQIKKEKESLDNKLIGFENASKDLDNLLESQRSDKNKEGLGYNAVPPPPAQVFSPPKKDLSWTGLPEFVKDTGNPQNNIDDKGYWDSGFSRHMTRNISYLFEYEPYDGGYVLFGHEGGKITDFKLKDDTNMFLRTSRQHNMYSIDLNNIVHHKNLTCLVAKALVDESMLWHRRLGHLNFKTMNKFTWTFFLRTKDDTSSILRNFITEIENIKDLNVKIIRCDNGGEFKNKEMNEFCTKKGIRREFSNARTPQQNGVAERRNRTLIEAARTIKAFRVFNKRTKKVEENMHVDFLVNKIIEKGAGPNWLFDINTLTNSMNYVPMVVAGTSSTNISGTKDVASQDVKKDMSSLRYIALPNWLHEAHMETRNSDAPDGCNANVPESSGISNLTATLKVPSADQVEPVVSLTVESKIPTISSPVPTEKGIDYEEVFAPVARIEAIRPFLAYASFMAFIVYQMDVKSAFLYGTIDEEVYVMQPLGFHDPEFPDRVYKVEKAIKHKGEFLLVQVYVDDIIFGLSNLQLCREFEALLHDKFQMSVMGELTFFLGLQVLQKKDGIFLSQYKYVGDILKKFGYSDVRSANIPMDKENPWGKDGPGKDVELHLYRSMIGSLMHLTASRPDIMFAVCACARHQVTPKECHLHAVKRIFRYLNGHPKLGLWYPKESPFDLVAYSNSDYGGATQDRNSTTGGCQFLGRRLISCNFIMAKLAFCDYHNMVAILEKIEHNTDFHQIVDFLEASHIRYALTISPTVYVSHIRQSWSTARIETTNQETKILATVDAPTETPTLRRYTRRAIQIAQSKALSPTADEPASLLRDDRQDRLKTIFHTIVSSLDAGQDRENIAKTFALPYESSPRVTSLDVDEGREELGADKSTELGSTDTKEMVNVLSSMEARDIFTSGGAAASICPADVLPAAGVPTISGSFLIIDAQVAIEMEEEFARENQRSNEVIAKHLREYEQAEVDLSVGEKLELISELVKYQDHHAKILKGMTLEQLKEKFIPVWKQLEDFVPMYSKEENVSEEELKGMMQLVPLEEVYIEALQVKHPIIDWEIHSEGKREYWKIIRLGGHTTVYQLFVDMLKQFDREDLHQLWTLVKETFSTKQATRDKEKELWVELKRLFEPNFEHQIWTYHQAFMHDPLDWKLYDTCGVHHVSTKDQEIFMLVERDYLLRRGLATVMICNKIQVEQYSQMANDLILKIHNIANSPR
nr:hypothetical protein [Tanacetum cinerariifolium]